jgi:hypothetical protein
MTITVRCYCTSCENELTWHQVDNDLWVDPCDQCVSEGVAIEAYKMGDGEPAELDMRAGRRK